MGSHYAESTFRFPLLSLCISILFYICIHYIISDRLTLPSLFIISGLIFSSGTVLNSLKMYPLSVYAGRIFCICSLAIIFLFINQGFGEHDPWFGVPVIDDSMDADSAFTLQACCLITESAVLLSPYKIETELELIHINGLDGVQASAGGRISAQIDRSMYDSNSLKPGAICDCDINMIPAEDGSFKAYIVSAEISGVKDTLLTRFEENTAAIHPFFTKLEKLKAYGKKIILRKIQNLSWESQLFVSALILGEPVYVYDPVFDDCRTSGCSYIIALSGMHAAIFLSIISLVLRPFLGKHKRDYVIMLLLIAYVWFTGFKPSLVRAAGMIYIGIFSREAGRPQKGITVLLYCSIVHMLLFPNSVKSVSFILSYSALAGILMGSNVMHDVFPWWIPAAVRSMLGAASAAAVSTWIYLAWVFGEIAPISLIAGIPSILGITVTVFCSIIYLVLPRMESIGKLLDICSELMRNLWSLTAEVPMYRINSPEKLYGLCIFIGILYMMGILLQLNAVYKRKRNNETYRYTLQLQLSGIDPGLPAFKKSPPEQEIRPEFYG
ncbi:MAG: ComEC/Rec2 family competence protein [Spirochaetia bacterium]|nr:ComEC/Rec2 family competence protein [Spirochaetia bacterium]MCF7946629.1 ComEC/Rec2 family competence protein [Spirochaetia bacterium]